MPEDSPRTLFAIKTEAFAAEEGGHGWPPPRRPHLCSLHLIVLVSLHVALSLRVCLPSDHAQHPIETKDHQ